MDWRDARRLEFDEWALPFVGDCYRTALCLAESESDAWSLVEKSFVRAYRAWQPFDSKAECRIWLYRIMASVFARRNRPAVAGTDDRIDEYFALPRKEIGRRAADISENPMAGMSGCDIVSVIRQLPGHLRLTLVLSFLGRFSYSEIAEIAGIPLEYVGFQLREGRQRLRESLTRYVEEQLTESDGSWGQEKMNG